MKKRYTRAAYCSNLDPSVWGVCQCLDEIRSSRTRIPNRCFGIREDSNYMSWRLRVVTPLLPDHAPAGDVGAVHLGHGAVVAPCLPDLVHQLSPDCRAGQRAPSLPLKIVRLAHIVSYLPPAKLKEI